MVLERQDRLTHDPLLAGCVCICGLYMPLEGGGTGTGGGPGFCGQLPLLPDSGMGLFYCAADICTRCSPAPPLCLGAYCPVTPCRTPPHVRPCPLCMCILYMPRTPVLRCPTLACLPYPVLACTCAAPVNYLVYYPRPNPALPVETTLLCLTTLYPKFGALPSLPACYLEHGLPAFLPTPSQAIIVITQHAIVDPITQH